MSEWTPNDEQRDIAEDIEGMMVVDAGPGTGKTETMIHRYANIISSGVPPEDVLMVTFTNGAAEEMAGRLGRLVPSEHSDRVLARTFDSLCLTIVMEFAGEVGRFFGIEDTGLSRGVRLVESDSVNLEHFTRFLDDFLLNRGDDYPKVSPLMANRAESIYDLLSDLMCRGIVPVSGGWFGYRCDEVINGDTERTLEMLEPLNDTMGSKGINSKQSALFAAYVKGDKDWIRRELPAGMKGLPREMVEEAVRTDRSELISFIHDLYLAYIRRSLSDNRLTFGLAEVLAFTVLYNSRELREANRYRYIIIDEFQDTNALQMMISLMLLSEPNLCVVGDWKQGIYGFRYSDVDNILRFGERVRCFRDFLNDDDVRIPFNIPEIKERAFRRNYRSSDRVLDAAYQSLFLRGSESEYIDPGFLFMGTGMGDDEIDEARGDPETMSRLRRDFVIDGRPELTSSDTHVRFIHTATKGLEAGAVLSVIKDYLSEGRYYVKSSEGKSERLEPSDIAVLCRTNNNCRAIVRALKGQVPVHLTGKVEVMSTREGKLALAWLRYVLNESNRLGYITILDDLGYSMEEMRGIGHHSQVPAILRERRELLCGCTRRFTELLTTLFSFYDGLDPDIVNTVITHYSGMHETSMMSIADIITVMEADILAERTCEVDSAEDSGSVRVMTIHKAKGREFPVVIVPYVTHKTIPFISRGNPLFTLNEPAGLRCKKEIVDVGNGYSREFDSWSTALCGLVRPTDYSEERRLLFVALSRAEQYITMVCDGGMHRFVDEVMDHLGAGFSDIPEPGKILLKEAEVLVDCPEFEVPPMERRVVGVHSIMSFPEEPSDEEGHGLDYGNDIHLVAEDMVWGINTDTSRCRYGETEMISQVLEGLKGARTETELECRLPVEGTGCILSGRIDLYAEFDDHVEVHDWKTDATDRLRDEYAVQLSVYAYAAEAATGKPVRCFIQYLSNGVGTVEVDRVPMEEIVQRVETLLDGS